MEYGSIGYKQLNGFLDEYERSQCLSVLVHFLTTDMNVECSVISNSEAACTCEYVQVFIIQNVLPISVLCSLL